MMLLKIDKKLKIFTLFFIFLLLTSLHNFNLLVKFENKFLNIININVYGADNNLNNIIKNELNILNGKNLLFLSKKKIQLEINDLKFIKSLEVKKIYPSSLMINYEQTKYLAKHQLNNQLYLINENGFLINEEIVNFNKNIPYFFGNFERKDFLKLKNILIKSNFKFDNIESIYIFPSMRWDLKLKNNITLKLPYNNIEKSLILADQLIKKFSDKKNYVIDLRVSDIITVLDA